MTGPIWLIGCGAMGGAMLSRWIETGLDPGEVTVIRPSGASVSPGVRVLTSLPDAPPPAILMLAMKPQQIDTVAPELQAAIGEETLLISILAGVRLAGLRERFPGALRVVRALPNLPVALGRGVTALSGDARGEAEALMAPLGLVEWIEDEDLFDVATALAGSGPAFTYRFIDALARAGTVLGLPEDQAARMALATVEGSGLLAGQSDASPATLADRVASKGGSTRKGLDVLDNEGALETLLVSTLRASVARNRELASPDG